MSNHPNLGKEPLLFYRKEVKMNKFWDLLKESTVTQAAVTVAVIGVSCYLWATGQPIPENLWTADTFVLGFFFGAKVAQVARRA
jgi:uncharacterized membrane protein